MNWESILKAPIQTTTDELQRVGLKPAQIKKLQRPVLQPNTRRKVKRKKQPSEEWDEETQGPEDNPWTEKEKATQARIDAEKGKNLTAAQRVQNARDRNKKGSVFVDGKFKPFSSKRGKKEERFVEDSEGNVVDRSEKPLTLKPRGKGPLSNLRPTPKRRVPTGEEGFLGRQKTKLQEQVDGEWKDKETFAQKEGERWKKNLQRVKDVPQKLSEREARIQEGFKQRKIQEEKDIEQWRKDNAIREAESKDPKISPVTGQRTNPQYVPTPKERKEDKLNIKDKKDFQRERKRGIERQGKEKLQEQKTIQTRSKQLQQQNRKALENAARELKLKPASLGESDTELLQRIKQANEQTERNTEATKEATTALTNAAKNLGNVNKMNNDKYNVKQKGEKNRNLTPFVMPQGKRPAPKTSDIPGVVQHPKRKQKKTENKW